MKTLWKRLMDEPAMIGAVFSAAIAILAPRLGLSAIEAGYLMAAVATLTGVAVRQSVVPERKVDSLGKVKR